MVNRMRGLRLLLLCAAVCIAGCQSMSIKSIDQQGEFSQDKDEARLWKRSEEFQDLLDSSGYIYDDPELTAYLNSVLVKFIPDPVRAQNIAVRVSVLSDPSFNAFVLPTGQMYVHSGLLASVENEAQLATVLGHELTHFLNRHSLKEFRSLKNKSAFYSTLAVTAGVTVGDLGSLLVQLNYMLSVFGYSKDLENEADSQGFAMLVKKGYCADEAPRAFEKLAQHIKEEKIKQPYLFSTHPRVQERIEHFRDLLGEAGTAKGESCGFVGEDVYNQKMKGLLFDNARFTIKINRYAFAQRQLERLKKLANDDARTHFLFGELHFNRRQGTDLEKAKEYYREAIAHNAGFADAYRQLGFACYKTGATEEGIQSFEKFLALSPDGEGSGYVKKYLAELKEKRKG